MTLTGVCPNDTFTVPIGKVLNYECFASFSTGSFEFYWNISGVAIDPFSQPIPFGISHISNSGTKSTLTIMAITTNNVLDIQCGLCNRNEVSCSNPVMFLGTELIQLITFGKLSIIFDVD